MNIDKITDLIKSQIDPHLCFIRIVKKENVEQTIDDTLSILDGIVKEAFEDQKAELIEKIEKAKKPITGEMGHLANHYNRGLDKSIKIIKE